MTSADRVTPDEYATWDAAYVLGSLDHAERLEFEAHLRTCASCRTAVAELAGLPASLDRVSGAVAQSLLDDSATPAPAGLSGDQGFDALVNRIRVSEQASAGYPPGTIPEPGDNGRGATSPPPLAPMSEPAPPSAMAAARERRRRPWIAVGSA
ncbi:MAG: zf-HC2 domain-containing protein, partial [Nocardia sp.]|nr:zf-HC2 domain-containing protein [Nocardia sp.]